MISRRRSKPMKVERRPAMEEFTVGEGVGVRSSLFFCLAATSRGRKGNRSMSYFCSNASSGEDAEAARALASLCLDHAPEHHQWHHHTTGGTRTFAFLADDVDGRTYLAIVEPSPGSAETVQFLQRVRDACSSSSRRMRPLVDHVVRQFVQALHAAAAGTGTSSSTTGDDVVLLGDPPSELADEEEARQDQLEGARRPRQVSWVRTWWRRYAGVVIAVDVVLCLVLFGVWMAMCHGFRCVQP